MAIVTISRGTFSGGKDLAECLAGRLGMTLISREVLREAAEAHGVELSRITHALERPPSLLDRLGWDRQVYLAWLREALCRRAAEGPMVYHGLGGHFLLGGIPGVCRVLVIANLSYRVRRAMEAQGFSSQDAVDFIRKVDADRRRWTRFLYGREWRDPTYFDLSVNLDNITLEEGCDLVERMLGFPGFEVTEKTKTAILDARLAAACEAALLKDHRTRLRKMDVRADGGVVTVHGIGKFERDRKAVQEVVEEIEGVTEVLMDVVATEGLWNA